ncbi:MAG: ketopantoate reductase C-terminal domain-containing protein [Patescibacteria group bacterium]|nr:ketopantoate reductase C-terminal domain-containing protein [Patescibacteria group bacterium]
MEQKKIVVIGVGGRTGTMLAFELSKKIEGVWGIGKEREIEVIKNKKLYVKREGKKPELFEGKVALPEEFSQQSPEIIFLTVKNPISPAVRYYYQKIKAENKKFPTLILSQNGLSAGREAIEVLKEIFGKEAEKIQVIRVSLFNPVDKEEIDEKIYIDYFLPIRLAFGVISGSKETKEIKDIFKKAGIEAEEISSENIKNMEFSKLLTNLIGMPSAARNFSIKQGFEDLEIFREEIEALREYIKVVKANKGKFLNFQKMPIKLLAILIYYLPFPILLFLRKKLAKAITKGRGGKPKGNLDEIDYYNGEVVRLGKELGIKTPVNEKILKKIRENIKDSKKAKSQK